MKLKRRKHLPIEKWFGIITNYFFGKIGFNKYWSKELKEYFGWKNEEEFYKVYAKKQKAVKKLWEKKERKTESAIRSFYSETDYWILRQVFVHKNDCFPEIVQVIPKNREIWFCEYGSGVGPVTRWLVNKFPNANFTLVDLPSPQLDFAKFRFSNFPNVEILKVPERGLPLKRKYDFITCLAVLEHVSAPLVITKHLIKHLEIGGTLFVDFQFDEPTEENLAQSQAERSATIDFLNTNLKAVWALDKTWKKDGGFGQYVKLKEI